MKVNELTMKVSLDYLAIEKVRDVLKSAEREIRKLRSNLANTKRHLEAEQSLRIASQKRAAELLAENERLRDIVAKHRVPALPLVVRRG